MNGIVKGTIAEFNGESYSAVVAFGMAFVDRLEEKADLSVEIVINPNPDYHDLNASVTSNESIFIFEENYATINGVAEKVYKSALNVSVEKINFQGVTARNSSIPLSKIVYISDRPLFTDGQISQEGDDSEFGGGASAGTYILVSNAGKGTVLYWVDELTATVIDLLDGASFAA